MDREEISHKELKKANEIVKEHITDTLFIKGRGTFASRHEILGVLEEELLELKLAIQRESDTRVVEELSDIAIVAIFGIACIQANKMDW